MSFSGLEISAHRDLNLELLLLLIELPAHKICINAVDDEIFEFSDGRDLQGPQEELIREYLKTTAWLTDQLCIHDEKEE